MRLALRVVLRSPRKIVYRSIDLNGDARLANGKVDRVSPNLMLAHDVDSVAAERKQHSPCARLPGIHAGASFGRPSARRMSQAPTMIMGMDSTMPMVR